MPKWILGFDENERFTLRGIDMHALVPSAFYKLSLRRYVDRVQEDAVVFHARLTYLDMKQVIALCTRQAQRSQEEVAVDDRVTDFIGQKEIYIQQRAKLGLEIKTCDARLQAEFAAYREVVDGCMVRKLREKQMWDSFFMCTMKRSSNFSVPGSGKTASVLGAYAYLKAKGMVRRIIVVSPKNAFGSWMDEFVNCFGDREPLRAFCIHDKAYKTVAARRKALLMDTGSCNLILLNYEALHSYREELAGMVNAATLLAFDEVHKVKRIGGQRAQDALDIARHASYAVAMTGTPIPNTYGDIYNLLHILYPDEYDMFFNFSPQELKKPSPEAVSDINERILPFFCRTNKRQLSVPDANADIILKVRAQGAENELFAILTKKYRRNKLALFLRVLQLESNPAALLKDLNLNDYRYILDDDADAIEGIDYADYSEKAREMIGSLQTSTKMAQCLALLHQLVGQGKTVIVWCIFIDTIRMLEKHLSAAGISVRCIFGEVSLEDRAGILDDFRTGRTQVLITNPHTLAESVSLHSACHDAVYFEYSYNLVHLLQSKDRIHRLGLPQGQYTQYYYMQSVFQAPDGDISIDQNVYDRLLEKERIMLEAIDKQILEVMPSSDDDLEMIFSELNLRRQS